MPAVYTIIIGLVVLSAFGCWGLYLRKQWKLSETRCRETQDRLDALFHLSTDGILIYDPASEEILDYNPQIANWLGKQPALDDFCQAGTPYTRRDFARNIQSAIDDPSATFNWCISANGDGPSLEFRISVRPINYHQKSCILICARNETEGRASEKRAKRLAGILESVGDGVATADLDGHITYVNKAWADMHGYAQKDLVGKHLNMFHSDQQVKQSVAPFNDIVLRKGSHSGEVGHKHADGSLFPTFMTTTLQKDGSGNPIGIIGVATNLSEQKKVEDALRTSEIKFRHLYNLTPEPIIVTDLTGRILDVNQKFCEFGERPRHQIIDQSALDIGFPADAWQQFITDLTMNGEVSDFETVFSGSNGSEFYLTMFAKLIEIKDEFLALIILHDVTAQRHLENRLREAQKLEAIGTLAGGIAHDFNNILSAILGYIELSMLKTDRQNKVFNYLDQVLKAANRAKDLVRQILSVSRQTEQRRKPLRVQPVIADVMKLMRASLPSSIEIHEEINPDAGSILADPGQIHQILMNLCTNAGQSMNDKGGVLTVALNEVVNGSDQPMTASDIREGRYIRITVGDTGHGIAEDVQKRIFDPYFTTKDKGMGTGLGLAVVQGIVKKHGGGVTFSSQAGVGTTFYIYLPMITKSEEESPDAHPRAEANAPGGTERILLVDDEEAIIDTGKQMLEYLGYEVTAFKSSLEALGVFHENPQNFDIVISDMTMPDMTGDELARRIIEIRRDIPFILCTGYNSRIDEESAKAIGIEAFVFKPVTLINLATTIRNVMDGKPDAHDGESHTPGRF